MSKQGIDIAVCYHCGENCETDHIIFNDLDFCCHGCKTVYSLLQDTGLCTYYNINEAPGVTAENKQGNFEFLELEEVQERIVQFSEGQQHRVTLYIPIIHCAACIWLLEKLNKLNDGVLKSEVNYLKKELTVLYNSDKISLKELVILLSDLGYTPDLQSRVNREVKSVDREQIIKLGVAGFVFGNIMLFSFPEYLNIDDHSISEFRGLFSWLNLMLALPVLLYCDVDYLKSAWSSIKHRYLTIDVPISLGILTLFTRSAFDVITGAGSGYFDSFSGLVFFLLIGKWFQSRTYSAMVFDRDFKSYFPMAVSRIVDGQESVCMIENLKVGDHIKILNNQIIPADSIILEGKGYIDYSFVTGESDPVLKNESEKVFAGGRQTRGALTIQVLKSVSQSYLTELWNQQPEKDEEVKSIRFSSLIDRTSRWFSIIILSIAFATLGAWLIIDAGEAINAFTSVLIIACPCALALAMPFTQGNVSRILGKRGFFIRNANILEAMSRLNTIVFDKTGTLTKNDTERVTYHGRPLSPELLNAIATVSSSSTHPLSQAISNSFESETCEISDFLEDTGLGVQATVNKRLLKLGSAAYCHAPEKIDAAAVVWVNYDSECFGYFKIEKAFRKGVSRLMEKLKSSYVLHLLSGDNDHDRSAIEGLFGKSENIYFDQAPMDKLRYVNQLESAGDRVAMFGDGLNDSGALKAATVGISVADDVYSFSPACDVIMQANNLQHFAAILSYVRSSMTIVKWSIVISLIYNVIGLWFAVQGLLTPLVAAILMPLSSITVVSFVTLLTSMRAPNIQQSRN